MIVKSNKYFFLNILITSLCLLLFLFSGCKAQHKNKKQAITTIRWWHINNDASGQNYFETIAKEFELLHPHVHIKITALDNMEFKPKLQLELAANDPPDIFHSWGGGSMIEQVQKGYLKEITKNVLSESWESKINKNALDLYSYKDKIYGFPHDLGAVGFWYNKKILADVGYASFPSTWDDLLALCDTLKQHGITPVSLGISDLWPVAYWWVYIALRINGAGLFEDVLTNKTSFLDPSFIDAGYIMHDFFGQGYLQSSAIGDDYPTQARLMGDQKCAMELMGQWALTIQAQSSESGSEAASYMSFAPFPLVKNGKGSLDDVIGGGNGFVIGRNAPDEAIALLEFFTKKENLQKYFDFFPAVPTVNAVTVENKGLNMVKDYISSFESYSLYPDQLFEQRTNSLINEVSARILLGDITPEQGGLILNNSRLEP